MTISRLNTRLTWQATPATSSLFFDEPGPRLCDAAATVSPEALSLLRSRQQHRITVQLDVAGDEPAAARRPGVARPRCCTTRRWNADPSIVRRCSSRSPSRAGIPGPALSRRRQAAARRSASRPCRRPNIWQMHVAVLRDRLARLQGRLSTIPGARQDLTTSATRLATSYRFNNGVPNQITQRATPQPLRRPEGRAGRVRAGQVDDRTG